MNEFEKVIQEGCEKRRKEEIGRCVININSPYSSKSSIATSKKRIKEIEKIPFDCEIKNKEDAKEFFDKFASSILFRKCFGKIIIPTPNRFGKTIFGKLRKSWNECNNLVFIFEDGTALPHLSSFQSKTHSFEEKLEVKVRKNARYVNKTPEECVEYFEKNFFGDATEREKVSVSSTFVIEFKNEIDFELPLTGNLTEQEKISYLQDFISKNGGCMDIYDTSKTFANRKYLQKDFDFQIIQPVEEKEVA